jgi:hypothetical protein
MRSLMFLLILIISAAKIFSLPSLNIADPSILKEGLIIPDNSFINVRTGFIKAYFYDEGFSFGKKRSYTPLSNLKISGSSSLAKFIINLKERLDIGALIGSETPKMTFKNQDDIIILHFKENLFLCGRAAATIFETAKYSVGANIAYYYFKAYTDTYLQNNILLYSPNTIFKKKGWQINIGIEKELTNFSPYIGIAICKNKAVCKNLNFLKHDAIQAVENRRIGCFLGISAYNNPCLLNIEIRLVNEMASYFSLEMRF